VHSTVVYALPKSGSEELRKVRTVCSVMSDCEEHCVVKMLETIIVCSIRCNIADRVHTSLVK
jgi:hypothetical protein